jgi:hypothetical protein
VRGGINDDAALGLCQKHASARGMWDEWRGILATNMLLALVIAGVGW